MSTRNDRQDHGTTKRSGRNPGERRRPHSIGFADPEWTLIEQAAARKGLNAAELVRLSAVAIAEERLFEHPPVVPDEEPPSEPSPASLAEEPSSEPSPASLSPGHIALIEATWRTVDLLATLATREMSYHEIDKLVVAASNAMIETMNKGSLRAVHGQSPVAVRSQGNERLRRAPHRAPKGYTRI